MVAIEPISLDGVPKVGIEEKASVDAIFRQWKDYLEEICSK